MTDKYSFPSSVYDVAVIGAGSSGMACALFLRKTYERSMGRRISIIIIERNQRPGKKLLMTGNGRCNLTHRSMTPEHFHGNRIDFCQSALAAFDNEDARRFFESIGLETFYDDSGKAFPVSLQASSVLDCMRYALEEEGISIMSSTRIDSIIKKTNAFTLRDERNNTVEARYIVVACGGAASPFTGSDGNGYSLLRGCGHTIIPPLAGIVQIKTETDFIRALTGIKAETGVSLLSDDLVIRTEYGEVLFTDYGLSGPPVLQLSGHASRLLFTEKNGKKNHKIELSIDFMIDRTSKEIEQMIRNRMTAFSKRKIENLLVGIFHNRLAVRLIKHSVNLPVSESISEMSDLDVVQLAKQIKQTRIRVTGVMPLENAQVTIGGASTEEFDPRTMESLLCEGLFACGEILDVDGDCGGYNLQWAWSSANAVARCISNKYIQQPF